MTVEDCENCVPLAYSQEGSQVAFLKALLAVTSLLQG